MSLMNTNQAAEFLGYHPVTIRKKVREREIPAVRVGGQWRFEETVLREWIAQGCPQQDEQPTLFEGRPA